MADDSGIDPRHPAQFQRGFDPHAHPVTPEPEAASRPAGPVRLAGGPAVTAERIAPPPRIVETASRPAERPVPAIAEETVPDDGEAPRPDWRTRAVEWSLPGAALVLVLVAIALFGEMVGDSQLYYGYSDATEYAWTRVRSALPGPLLVAAIVALTAWIVLRALRPKGVAR